jgi:hypothetical protein
MIALLALLASPAEACTCPTISVEEIIDYAATGVGSNYVWGGGQWDPSNRSWSGADCSGFSAKSWQVPNYTSYKTYAHPYYTGYFVATTDHWYDVSRGSAEQGDQFVYHRSGAGHVLLFDRGDPWGSFVSYEAKGTAWGIVHASRTCASYYKVQRRHNLDKGGTDADGDGHTDVTDCDDADKSVYPGAPEACDGEDDDCDGRVDEGFDADKDGWKTCEGDCDDKDAAVHPAAPELCDGEDNDCGGDVDEGYDDDADGYSTCEGDCADADASRHPGAPETADGVDEDCDYRVDDGTSAYDDDGDGWTDDAGDCDDADAWAFPGAPEVADGGDDDCDAIADEGTEVSDDDGDGWSELDGDCDDADATAFPGASDHDVDALDGDCDGFADEGSAASDDDGDGFSEDQGDCDDQARTIYPDSPEVEDGDDNDCDGVIDEGTLASDDDGDGFSEDAWDCDDTDSLVFPGAEEVANGLDDDCNFRVDDRTPASDDDADGWTEDRGDCDDANAFVFPGGVELADGADNDCDGISDDGTDAFDDDRDGFSERQHDCDDARATAYPGAPESTDGRDDDCDGLVDDETDSFDDDGDGWTELAGDCDDDDAHAFPGAWDPLDGRDADCDGSSEQAQGWACSSTGSSSRFYGAIMSVLMALLIRGRWAWGPRAALCCVLLAVASPAFAGDTDGDGYSEAAGDCDDTAPAIHPGASESANGVDDDCDYKVDEGTSSYDDDGDAWTEKAGDCDDANPLSYPGAAEWKDGADNDCDGKSDEGTSAYDDDGDGWSEDAGDCDDTKGSTFPGAGEAADGLDQDCDGVADDGTSAFDDDHDGWTEDAGDCDDGNVWTWPGAIESGDGEDNDCDGLIDDNTDLHDDDNDGYAESEGDCDDADVGIWPGGNEIPNDRDDDCDGTVDEGTDAYDDDGDGRSEWDADCDDMDAWTFPDAPEQLDTKDNDCDGIVDETTAAYDDDGDTFSEEDGDCSDWDATVYPGAVEEPDLVDDDCDFTVDEGTILYDDDGDGFSEEEGDCDDADLETWPGAPELNDEVDNDCDGEAEVYHGWACSTSAGFGGWLPALLALIAVLAPRGARAGLETELPEDRRQVRLLVCDDMQDCARDATFIESVEGGSGRPFLPVEIVLAPEEVGAGEEIDRPMEWRSALDAAEALVAKGRGEAALKELDRAQAAMRAWPEVVPQKDLVMAHWLRGAALLLSTGSGYEYDFRQAAALSNVGRATSFEFPAAPDKVEAAWTAEQRKVVNGGTGRLKLGDAGPNVVYSVDGVPTATRELTLLPGLHRVTASSPGAIRTWVAEVPVLPARTAEVTADFAPVDDLPWVHDGLDQAFATLQAPGELTELLAAWCKRHGIQKLEVLAVEETARAARSVDVKISDARRKVEETKTVGEDGLPMTFSERVVATHEDAISAHAETIQRVRVVFFDPRTQRFGTDAGSQALLMDVAEPQRLTVGLEGGYTSMLDRNHATGDVALGWTLRGPIRVEARVGLAHADEPYNLYTDWVDGNVYHAALGLGWAAPTRVTPFLVVGPEVYVPVAVGGRADAGLQVALGGRDARPHGGGEWLARIGGHGSFLDAGLSYGAGASLARRF